jgi:voltage-gated potassium channel
VTAARRVLIATAAVYGTAAAIILAGGSVYGIVENVPLTTGWYWAVETATTVGYGDVTPRTPHGRLVAVIVMLVLIPLLAIVFARVNSALTRARLAADLDEIREIAQKAHRIAADTWHHHTGTDHPDAPPGKDRP